MAKSSREYWDACSIIALLNREEPHVGALRNMYNEVRDGDRVILTSAISIAECGGSEKGTDPNQQKAIEEFFRMPGVVLVNVDRFIGDRARLLRDELAGKRKLPGNDSIHLATALQVNADQMVTTDKGHLLRLNGQFTTKGGMVLPIVLPHWEGAQQLPHL